MRYTNQRFSLSSTRGAREELRKVCVTTSYQRENECYSHIADMLRNTETRTSFELPNKKGDWTTTYNSRKQNYDDLHLATNRSLILSTSLILYILINYFLCKR